MIAILISGVIAGIISILATPVFTAWIKEKNIGQKIRDDGPQGHHLKAGTPTIGGVVIVASAVLGYAVAHSRIGAVYTRMGILVVALIVAVAAVGFLDDWIKIRNDRSLGLRAWQKMGGLTVAAAAFSIAAVYWAKVDTNLSFTRFDVPGIDLGSYGWIVFATLTVVFLANAVNLTDGLDGLAAGSSLFPFFALLVIGFWQLRHNNVYQVLESLDLALIAAAMAGACIGFLWWNAAPARIFMGDTGSLAIGAALAGLGLALNVHALLALVAFVFILEACSVMLQVFVFKAFKRKRLFRMAPIHHHLELGGWPETHVIIRLWLLGGMCCAFALGIFYADFLSTGSV